MNTNDGISEVVGSILLVSLVVLAVAIIGVGFLSQPPPVQVQELNVIAGNDTNTLYLYHDGGDPMLPGEFKILLDGIEVRYETPEISGAWSIGERINIPITQRPERIQIISTRGGQENLIRQISVGQVTGGGVPVTPGPAPTPGPGGGCTQEQLDEYAQEYLEDNYVEYFSEKLDEDAVYFTRVVLGGQSSMSGFVNLTINSTGSYIVTDANNGLIPAGEPIDLNFGDTLSVKFGTGSNPSADLFSVGSKGWSIGGYRTDIYRNGVKLNGDLIDSWITAFKDYESSLTFTSRGNNLGHTRLIIKNQTIIDEANSQTITLTNVKPAEPTLLVLKYPRQSNDKIIFVGQADQVEVGNTVIFLNGILNI